MSIECTNALPGWRLHFCSLRVVPGAHEGTMRLALGGTLATFHGRISGRGLFGDPVIAALRARLTSDGIDPTLHPPASQLLAERVLAGDHPPSVSLADDFCTLLVLKTLAPWVVADSWRVRPPLEFRRGRPGESLMSDRETVAVAGWPLLLDANGPLATPLLARSSRPAADAEEILLVCFQPAEVAEVVAAKVHLGRFVVMTWAYRFVEERVARLEVGR